MENNKNKGFFLQKPFLIICAIGAAMGCYCILQGLTVGEMQHLTVSDFVSGRVTDSRLYGEVTGTLDDFAYTLERDGKEDSLYAYIPLWENKDTRGEVTVILSIEKTLLDDLAKNSDVDGNIIVRGMIDPVVPETIKEEIKKYNMEVAFDCWVIRTGRTPSDRVNDGLIMFGVTFLIATIVQLAVKYDFW